MFRIAHISDLHWQQNAATDPALAWLRKRLGSVEVEAKGHDAQKLDALKNELQHLRPHLIVVTGDLTNFGDRESFVAVKSFLKKLQSISGARKVIAVPGNHDSLTERAYQLRKRWPTRLILEIGALLYSELNSPYRLSRKLAKRLGDGGRLPLLTSYREIIGSEFGIVDPAQPDFINVGWGEIAIFSFNSSNDAGVMANEGRIGPQQFNALNSFIANPENERRLARCVQIALLHHHPISAPRASGAWTERVYNWMQDGPAFLEYMNSKGFHFILHGHEHVPFQCSVAYEGRSRSLHIVAAGSALQNSNPASGSFNVLDLLSPFQLRLSRYDYRATGFSKSGEMDCTLPVRPLREIRLSRKGTAETSADAAVRNLFTGQPADPDVNHSYTRLEYRVTVTPEQLYRGSYRRVGRVVVEEGTDDGPIFVITGSPAMRFEDMKVSAFDNRANKSLPLPQLLGEDDPYQKVIQAFYELPLSKGALFDITFNFEWQSSDVEPNDFDGFNLMQFGHPIERVEYRVTLPWRPIAPKVKAYGIEPTEPTLKERALEQAPDSSWVYRFAIDKPAQLAYLVFLKPFT